MKNRAIILPMLMVPSFLLGQVLKNESGNTIHIETGAMLFVGGNFENQGILSGEGTVQTTDLFGNGGTVTPGSSPGLLTVTGDLTMNGKTYPCEINGTTAGADHDVLAVSGAANLTDGIINVTWGFTPLVSNEFTIMTFGSRTGTPTVNVPVVGGLTFVPIYTANNIKLVESSVLPIELISFTAKVQGDEVHLEWKTASENNNAGFEVERRREDDTQWQTLGFVEGKGTIDEEQRYLFIDQAPLPGLQYYRLRQLDFDGKFQYSNIVYAEMESKIRFSIYPNPTNGNLTIKGDLELDSPYFIYDAVGQLVRAGRLSEGAELDISQLANGVYFMKLLVDSTVNSVEIIKR